MNITRAFPDGMKEASPREDHTIHVIDKHIEYCTGCFACMRNGGTCIHDDDVRRTGTAFLLTGRVCRIRHVGPVRAIGRARAVMESPPLPL